MNEAYNVDCLEYMRSLPDNAFDLLIADPPYGGGFTEGGGCKGWFSKYHQNLEENQKRELGAHFVRRGRSKRYAEIYENDDCSQSVQVERERERTGRSITDSETQGAGSRDTSVTRTGGTWAEKYGKKLSRGTLPHRKIISKKCSASHAIRSFGAAITSGSRRRGAF